MSSTYRRLSRIEIDSELKQRKSREEKIDFLNWLLLQDEEAYKLLPEEDDEYSYVNFNREGVRYISQSGVAEIEEMESIARKTRAYREFIQNRIDYWEKAKTDHGPFPVEKEIGDSDEGLDLEEPEPQPSNTTQAPERIEWRGGKADLVYLFMRLQEGGFLGLDYKAAPWTLLKQHFELEEGKDLGNLKQTKQNIENSKSGKSREGDKIDSIISEIEDLPEEEKIARVSSEVEDHKDEDS